LSYFSTDNLCRGKRSLALDLKSKEGQAVIHRIIHKVDVIIEPFRPGVMEKLNIGPEVLCKLNPKLIYARLTGFGQTGPYSKMAGHDINYIGVAGSLDAFRRKGENPLFPTNTLGDFAGGGMLCVMGILLSLVERNQSGKGQVIDSAMLDGSAYLSVMMFKMLNNLWSNETGTNMLDTGSHMYETYKTKDNKYVAVGALEPQFYAELLKGLGFQDKDLPNQMDSSQWPAMKKLFAERFLTKTQTEWQQIFDGTDACCTPILSLKDVMKHPHNQQRQLLITRDSDHTVEPTPAPRLSRTPGDPHANIPLPQPGQHTEEILSEYGFNSSEINKLKNSKIILQNVKVKAKL